MCLAVSIFFVSPAEGQTCTDSTVPGTLIGFTPLPGVIEKPNSCNLLPCYKPEEDGGAYLATDENCDALSGACPVRLRVPLKFPGNSQMPNNGHVRVYWFDQATPDEAACLPPPLGSCLPISICGPLGAEILVDRGETWIQVGASCDSIASGEYAGGSFSLSAYACQTFSGECTERLDVPGLELPSPEEMWDLLGCDVPPPPCETCTCTVGGGSSGGGGSPGGGPPPASPPRSGPGALLRYQAKGAGHSDYPGATVWQAILGRYWSHDYAERIVVDPGDSHVWLITRAASFLEFSNLQGGVYQDVEPSDEYRRLSRTTDGWELRDLVGTVRSFDASGRWTSTVDRFGNAIVGSYADGKLSSVSFPDARSEIFSYGTDGRLALITEVGVDGTTSRDWLYTWSGLDLVRIDRPDGTSWAFRYEDPRHPGYMTRLSLVGTDGSERVEGAWEYDGRGNVLRFWRGDVSSTGPNAVDAYSFVYDNPFRPTRTEVTDPLDDVTVYEMDRDPGGIKPRITQISGACSVCGFGSEAQLEYGDPRHPLLPTLKTDASGTRTRFAYDENGRLTSRIEAADTPLEREVRWSYDTTYPALLKSIEWPSVAGEFLVKRTEWIYDARGAVTRKIEEGYEDGAPYRLETAITITPQGRLGSVDPPELGSQDVISISYDLTRGGLVPTGRTEPLIGSTSRDYDAFNRLTALNDPNGLVTEVDYDSLNRVRSVRKKGATASADLFTEYRYSVFGEPKELVLPEGNRVRLGRDSAGRLTSVERFAAGATQPFERLSFTLDNLGNRLLETRESWDSLSGTWMEQGRVRRSFQDRCRLEEITQGGSGGAVSVTRFGYNCDGMVEEVWDANHETSPPSEPTLRLSYDELDRLTRIESLLDGDPTAMISRQFGYDVHDRRTEVIDAEGSRTTYTYSDRGLITLMDSEIAGTELYRYDPRGRMAEKIDPRGVATEFHYDLLDRMTLVDTEGQDQDTIFTWDDPGVPFSKGRLTELTRGDVHLAYRYDRFGRVLQEGKLIYEYDRNGNRTGLTYPSGVHASYTFDAANRESTLSLELPDGTLRSIVTAAEYLPAGPLTSRQLGNGLTEVHSFDKRYYPTSITLGGGQPLLNWGYGVDQNGNPTSIVDRLDAANGRSFSYQDVQYFLTEADGPWGELNWTYDAAGNRLQEKRAGALTTYAYSANEAGRAALALESVGSASDGTPPTRYRHAADGAFTHTVGERSLVRYRYSADQRLAEVSWDVADEIPATTRFTYDGRGYLRRAERFRLETDPVASLVTEVAYSQGGTPYEVARSRFVNSGTARGQGPSQSVESLVYFAGTPVALLRLLGSPEAPDDVSLVYLSTDHLGTPVVGTDGAGAVVWRSDREPFGVESAPVLDGGIGPGLPGQWQDPAWDFGAEHRLLYNVHRWYLPTIGLYTQPDPLGVLGSKRAAELTYAEQSPLAYVDPLGLKTCFFFSLAHLTSVGDYSLVLVDHAALYFDGTCSSDECDRVPESLYDPSGSWLTSELGSGRLTSFSYIGKTLADYLDYQCIDDQSFVELICFNTTCCEERKIQEAALEMGGVRPVACSASVSNSVSGVGPFEGIEPDFWPAALRRQVAELFLSYSHPGRYQRVPCSKNGGGTGD